MSKPKETLKLIFVAHLLGSLIVIGVVINMASSVPPLVVKGPAARYMELFEGMKEHFQNLYGNWGVETGNSGETTVMCPAFFSRDYISPVGDVSGAVPLNTLKSGFLKLESVSLILVVVFLN